MKDVIVSEIADICLSSELSVGAKADIRKKITDLETEVKRENQLEILPTHRFSKGVYSREIVIPKGALIIGAIHKHQNMNIISKGDVSFLSIDGASRVQAPHSFVASPGVKRVIFAHEETVWTTIHGTSETDLDKIENEFIAKTYTDFYLSTDKSFLSAIGILGSSEEHLLEVSENIDDQIPFAEPLPDIVIAKSDVHGLGVFATREFIVGEKIAYARIMNKRTPVGRYTNHGGSPNARMKMLDNEDVVMIATKNIGEREEILTDYYFNYTNTRSLQCHGS